MHHTEKKIPVFFRSPKSLVDEVRNQAHIEERPIGNMYIRVLKKGLAAMIAANEKLQNTKN